MVARKCQNSKIIRITEDLILNRRKTTEGNTKKRILAFLGFCGVE